MAELIIKLKINTDNPGDFRIKVKETGGNEKEGDKNTNPVPPQIVGTLSISNPTVCYWQGGVRKCITW